jgi:hypothetical protein
MNWKDLIYKYLSITRKNFNRFWKKDFSQLIKKRFQTIFGVKIFFQTLRELVEINKRIFFSGFPIPYDFLGQCRYVCGSFKNIQLNMYGGGGKERGWGYLKIRWRESSPPHWLWRQLSPNS